MQRLRKPTRWRKLLCLFGENKKLVLLDLRLLKETLF